MSSDTPPFDILGDDGSEDRAGELDGTDGLEDDDDDVGDELEDDGELDDDLEDADGGDLEDDEEALDDEADELDEPLQPASQTARGGLERLEQIVRPVIEDFGLELYDLELGTRRGRTVLDVTVDRPGGREPGQGITLSELIEVNREISATLDVDDPFQGRYELEVHSPGVERPLTRARHYERSLGEAVHVVFNRILDGQTAIDGTLSAFAEERATIVRPDGSELTVDLEAIKSARTVYDWDAASGKKKKGGKKASEPAESRTHKSKKKKK